MLASSMPWWVCAKAGAFNLLCPACHMPARATLLPTVLEHSDCALDFVGMQMRQMWTPRPCTTEPPVELPTVLTQWWVAISLPNKQLAESMYQLQEGLAAGVPLVYLSCQYCGAAHIDEQPDLHCTHHCQKCVHLFCTV